MRCGVKPGWLATGLAIGYWAQARPGPLALPSGDE